MEWKIIKEKYFDAGVEKNTETTQSKKVEWLSVIDGVTGSTSFYNHHRLTLERRFLNGRGLKTDNANIDLKYYKVEDLFIDAILEHGVKISNPFDSGYGSIERYYSYYKVTKINKKCVTVIELNKQDVYNFYGGDGSLDARLKSQMISIINKADGLEALKDASERIKTIIEIAEETIANNKKEAEKKGASNE